jgi:hypothetical protein
MTFTNRSATSAKSPIVHRVRQPVEICRSPRGRESPLLRNYRPKQSVRCRPVPARSKPKAMRFDDPLPEISANHGKEPVGILKVLIFCLLWSVGIVAEPSDAASRLRPPCGGHYRHEPVDLAFGPR